MIDRVHLLRRLCAQFQTRVQRLSRARALALLEAIRLVTRQQRKHLRHARHVPALALTRALGVDAQPRLAGRLRHRASPARGVEVWSREKIGGDLAHVRASLGAKERANASVAVRARRYLRSRWIRRGVDGFARSMCGDVRRRAGRERRARRARAPRPPLWRVRRRWDADERRLRNGNVMLNGIRPLGVRQKSYGDDATLSRRRSPSRRW